jgi:tetratricopeptide (TPR) repeat protein
MAGCSSTPLVPTEDRNNLPTQTEQTKPEEPAMAVPLAEEIINRPQAAIETTKPRPNKAIVPISPAKIVRSVQQSTAVVALLDEANSYSQQGDLRSAQTRLQRAQRIAPRDPEVYYALAKTHLELQDYNLAEQVALKGVSIVQGQAQQLRRFWTLIAQTRQAAGNLSGAKQAQQSADRY